MFSNAHLLVKNSGWLAGGWWIFKTLLNMHIMRFIMVINLHCGDRWACETAGRYRHKRYWSGIQERTHVNPFRRCWSQHQHQPDDPRVKSIVNNYTRTAHADKRYWNNWLTGNFLHRHRFIYVKQWIDRNRRDIWDCWRAWSLSTY